MSKYYKYAIINGGDVVDNMPCEELDEYHELMACDYHINHGVVPCFNSYLCSRNKQPNKKNIFFKKKNSPKELYQLTFGELSEDGFFDVITGNKLEINKDFSNVRCFVPQKLNSYINYDSPRLQCILIEEIFEHNVVEILRKLYETPHLINEYFSSFSIASENALKMYISNKEDGIRKIINTENTHEHIKRFKINRDKLKEL